MEFLKPNLINTTSSIVVDNNTITSGYVLDRDLTFQYVTEGRDDDSTSATMTLNFDETTTLNRMAIMGHNLKAYTVYYNGNTATTLSLTSGPTVASDYSSNSETSQYLQFNDINCTSVSIQLKSTIEADNEKALGYVMLSEQKLDFSRIPPANGYRPRITPDQVVHKLADGGTRIHTTGKKFSVQIKYKNLDETFTNSLRDLYDEYSSVIYVAFGTATAWDKILHDVVWPGKFEFLRYSDNAVEAGRTGSIDLRET